MTLRTRRSFDRTGSARSRSAPKPKTSRIGWTEQLGPPDERIVETGQLGWPLETCTERRAAYWAATGLTVAYTDRDRLRDLHHDPTARCLDAVHGCTLVLRTTRRRHHQHHQTWTFEASRPPHGIGLGSTVAEMRIAHPHVEFGTWDIDEFSPASFHVFTDFEGRIDWNAVINVQQALNEQRHNARRRRHHGPSHPTSPHRVPAICSDRRDPPRRRGSRRHHRTRNTRRVEHRPTRWRSRGVPDSR